MYRRIMNKIRPHPHQTYIDIVNRQEGDIYRGLKEHQRELVILHIGDGDIQRYINTANTTGQHKVLRDNINLMVDRANKLELERSQSGGIKKKSKKHSKKRRMKRSKRKPTRLNRYKYTKKRSHKNRKSKRKC